MADAKLREIFGRKRFNVAELDTLFVPHLQELSERARTKTSL